MTQLFTKNAKLKKAEYNTVNFGIPALKTCPSKDICGEKELYVGTKEELEKYGTI